MNSYQKRKAELKAKDQIIESLKRELDAKNQADKFKDQIIESKDQTIKSQNQTIKSKDQIIEFQAKFIEPSTEEKYRDEEKEHSKSCLSRVEL
ncbi:hypothetical protein B0X58_07850 [Helicobacter pylori]|uniref:hypothetical protein n=1 Tax=Helicobacter pylori TaxID=210 RepID=UPI0009937B13|nr:hypothetical protein [Helicobacter pylori]OOQ30455.1 hypothetical protein B0X58_07850 [Helicobacter pylori]PDW59071.1 hypothetical protein BB442_06760 [Helicobacter pylori]WQU51976.1 hypothetical protein KVD28_06945 [Helicobacter pylori]